MQLNNKNINLELELELEQILIDEGWLSNMASIGGLSAALAFGGHASNQKAVNVSQQKKPMPSIVKSQEKPLAQKSPALPTKSSSDSMFDYISQWEGMRTKVYKDHAGNLTIGIGHFLNNTESDRKLIKLLFGDKVNYDSLLTGKQELTKDQVQKLFNVDVKIKEKLATKLIPDYDKFDQGTKNAIINALYRGDLGKKTIKLINDKNWKAAAIEYLNHKNAKTGPEQVKRRMKTNAALLYKNS